MDPRKEHILKLVVEQYVDTAEPVGSKALARAGLSVSPATIRNDLAVLEEEGLVRQPHTSAGRVPTEQAYLYYLQRFGKVKQPARAATEMRRVLTSSKDDQEAAKAVAKSLANLCGEAVVAGLGAGWSYYTGLSNLFGKPEFTDLAHVASLSELVDRFDDIVCGLFRQVPDSPKVMIGAASPFGRQMGAVVVRFRTASGRDGMLGIVGPMRMNYARNIALMEAAKDAIDNV
jgi:heat-inducible transcriptional repressor